SILSSFVSLFFNDNATSKIYTLSLHDALPIYLFIVIAVIYENPNKKTIAERFKNDLSALTSLNNDFIISGDHMKPDAELISEIGDEGVLKVLDRLYDVKKAELLVGKHL